MNKTELIAAVSTEIRFDEKKTLKKAVKGPYSKLISDSLTQGDKSDHRFRYV